MIEKRDLIEKILFILNPEEGIEYASLEKEGQSDVLVLTNQRIIYTNYLLLQQDIFHTHKIKNNTFKKIDKIKKELQLNNDVKDVITNYFN
jgi:hypothetical protein